MSSGPLIPREEECPREQLDDVLRGEALLAISCGLFLGVLDEMRHVP